MEDRSLEESLLPGEEDRAVGVQDGSVDMQGRPVSKAHTGGWKACGFIFGNEVVERIVYNGVASNLVSYMTGTLRQDMVTAAKSINEWSGTICITPFIGAFLADSSCGLYWTIAVTSAFYLVGLVMLTLSASLPGLKPDACLELNGGGCSQATPFQLRFFYASLYILCIGSGGIKPCASAFGANQFDALCPVEKVKKSSFFNWWFVGIKLGVLFSVTVVVYIQDNVGWGWGFGIPMAAMAVATVLFFAGTPYYRHQLPSGSPLTRYCQVLVAAVRNWRLEVPADPNLLHRQPLEDDSFYKPLPHTNRFLWLDKAATFQPGSQDKPSRWNLCTVTQVEEVKIFAGIVPVWVHTLFFNVVVSQVQTFFVLQGRTLDGQLTPGFQIPPASLQIFVIVPVLIGLPLYDRLLVPFLRRITGHERGITMLQRIGTGMVIVVMVSVAAALTERRRLRVAAEYGALDFPETTLPMSIFWLIPQYLAMGVNDIFTGAGLMEFYYDQVPDNVKSIGSAISVSAIGIGAYVSAALIATVTLVTGRDGNSPWLIENINRSRLDNFYWLLAAISTANMLLFIVTAKGYTYKKPQHRAR